LRILGFPSDDFGHQQGTREEIKHDFADVMDILFEPALDLAHNPMFAQLTAGGAPAEWNFAKFLVDDRGRVVRRYPPKMDAQAIARDIRDEL